MKLTKEKHKALIKAFSEKPGNIKHALEYAGVSRPTATKAWYEGYKATKTHPGYAPIKDIVEAYKQEEVYKARAILEEHNEAQIRELREAKLELNRRDTAQRLDDSRAKAAKGAIKQKVKEQAVSDAIIASVASSLPKIHRLSGSIDKIVARLAIMLEDAATRKDLSITEAFGMITRYLALQEKVVKSTNSAMLLSRKALGEPDQIVQVINGPGAQIDESDAQELLGGDPNRVLNAIKSLIVDRNPNSDAQLLLQRQREKLAEAAARDSLH